jgi:hypothetical protein
VHVPTWGFRAGSWPPATSNVRFRGTAVIARSSSSPFFYEYMRQGPCSFKMSGTFGHVGIFHLGILATLARLPLTILAMLTILARLAPSFRQWSKKRHALIMRYKACRFFRPQCRGPCHQWPLVPTFGLASANRSHAPLVGRQRPGSSGSLQRPWTVARLCSPFSPLFDYMLPPFC